MRRHLISIALAWSLFPVGVQSARVLAEDAFYDVPLSDLKITAGGLPKVNTDDGRFRFDPRWEVMEPTVWLDGEGEAYLMLESQDLWNLRFHGQDDLLDKHLRIRAPKGKDVKGWLTLPKTEAAEMKQVGFAVPASAAKDSAQEAFLNGKMFHYFRMERLPVPGKAWFRHQFDDATTAASKLKKKDGNNVEPFRVTADSGRIVDAFDLFSGTQAISESLQLDRALRDISKDSRELTIDVGTLTGITVTAIDWKPLLKEASPKLDPLAKLIPADQHVVFFSSFAAAVKLTDELNGRDPTLLVHLARPQSEDASVLKKYERQLGLGVNTLGRIVGPQLVKGIALTGSDPYFPTGTDVAVLLESDQPKVLASALKSQILLDASKQSDAKPTSGMVAGVKYDGVRSPGREVCSYLAQLNGAVVITNSLAQLERLAKVGQGMESIAKLDEYKFFRTRYQLGDENETAFLFLSDPTIRRWCSPQWRIASARRTYTAAALAELTAENLNALESGKAEPKSLHTDLPLVDASELTLTKSGVVSSTQGSLEFMTPIIELPIQKVTKAEADAYNQWRDRYQNNWRWAFDPIGLRIGISDKKLSGDLTVMPLIIGSDYREFVNISRGAKIPSDGADLHGALAQTALAINTDSKTVKDWTNMAVNFVPQFPGEPFGWLGRWVTVSIEDDPIWKEVDKTPPEKLDEFYRKNWQRIPIAVEIESIDPQKLTVFVDVLRAFLDKIMPGTLVWDSFIYRDQTYVQVKFTENARHKYANDVETALYSAPIDGVWILTPREDVLKRAIDRQLARATGEKKSDTPDVEKQAVGPPWLGQNLCLQIDRRMFDMLNHSSSGLWGILNGPESKTDLLMQERAWANLPILNEWKRLFPNEDPVVVHERLWHTKLVCPGGGKYVWNDEWKTMESTVYGHPGQPKDGPWASAAMLPFETANFGLTFEEQGLRARMELTRNAK